MKTKNYYWDLAEKEVDSILSSINTNYHTHDFIKNKILAVDNVGLTGIDSENVDEIINDFTKKLMNTFNVVYLREYADPDNQGDFFYAYETVYRNVPEKYRLKFDNQKMKMKIIRFLDWNYKESAQNFANSTRIELIDQDKYYQTFKDVFGETAADNQTMFNDYGQGFARQSLRKDFNPKLTKTKIKDTKYAFNNKGKGVN